MGKHRPAFIARQDFSFERGVSWLAFGDGLRSCPSCAPDGHPANTEVIRSLRSPVQGHGARRPSGNPDERTATASACRGFWVEHPTSEAVRPAALADMMTC